MDDFRVDIKLENGDRITIKVEARNAVSALSEAQSKYNLHDGEIQTISIRGWSGEYD